jgi:hypothetical protein
MRNRQIWQLFDFVCLLHSQLQSAAYRHHRFTQSDSHSHTGSGSAAVHISTYWKVRIFSSIYSKKLLNGFFISCNIATVPVTVRNIDELSVDNSSMGNGVHEQVKPSTSTHILPFSIFVNQYWLSVVVNSCEKIFNIALFIFRLQSGSSILFSWSLWQDIMLWQEHQ